MAGIDSTTKDWIRNTSDEKAAAKGCRFEPERGQFAVDWIARYCRLYEGEHANQPMELRDWQYECTMRLFSWVRWSEKWGRWIRRFRQASIWVPKKNKKSPTLAAWGLHLLCGDGEMGQKVFFAAKDGAQAREIAGKHAIEMLMQSDPLMAECTINKSLMQITHEPTRSIMKPLSSSNSRTQKSKEGLNGSVLIDETHVVDREFIDRINRAGISRSEPLQIEVSTAGDNPDGYGKERFDHAEKVIKGEREDQGLFAAIYAAPQDVSDADLDADPLKYGRMANPSMGHTVDPEEFLSDYAQSKVSLSKLGTFKMYRLNVWQHSTSPWLKMGDWESCRTAFTEDDLAGQTCWAGLDLSKTRDMSALVLAFPDPEDREAFYLLPYFWLPEERAKENNHLAPFLDWRAGGHLSLTPGNVIDYGYIDSAFRRLAEKFKIANLAYDIHFAEQVTQAWSEGVIDHNGEVIREGMGIKRYEFPQTITRFASPTAEFERMVLAGKLHHNGHPVMTWQVGHTQVKTDANNNKRPVKPGADTIKKIDGVVAGIMALGVAIEEMGEYEPPSIYETEGMMIL